MVCRRWTPRVLSRHQCPKLGLTQNLEEAGGRPAQGYSPGVDPASKLTSPKIQAAFLFKLSPER